MSNDDTRIRDRAYTIWEVQGKHEGREKEHWEQAQTELSSAEPGDDRTPDKRSAK